MPWDAFTIYRAFGIFPFDRSGDFNRKLALFSIFLNLAMSSLAFTAYSNHTLSTDSILYISKDALPMIVSWLHIWVTLARRKQFKIILRTIKVSDWPSYPWDIFIPFILIIFCATNVLYCGRSNGLGANLRGVAPYYFYMLVTNLLTHEFSSMLCCIQSELKINTRNVRKLVFMSNQQSRLIKTGDQIMKLYQFQILPALLYKVVYLAQPMYWLTKGLIQGSFLTGECRFTTPFIFVSFCIIALMGLSNLCRGCVLTNRKVSLHNNYYYYYYYSN